MTMTSGCGALTPPTTKSLIAAPGSPAFAWFTGWIPSTGLAGFDALLNLLNVQGNFRAQVVAQYAQVRTDAPDAPTVYGTAQGGAGARVVQSGDIKTTTGTKLFVRFGVKYDVSSGTNAASADVELQIAYDICGQVVGSFADQLVATSETKIFIALTPFVPSIQAAKMKAAVIVNGLGGNFKWRMTYRTAEFFPASPDAWQADWDSPNNPERGATEVNTGELSPTTTGKMWVQFGIMIYLSTGYTTPGQATVQATVMVRK
jgi:hypothetical protein